MFFSPVNKVNLSNNRKTIKLLTELRVEGYPMREMRKINTDATIKKDIKDLCLHLGSHFIKSELAAEGNEASFLAEKGCFDSILKVMYQSSNFFSFIHYATDLLQFYTLSSQTGIETKNLIALDHFIVSKTSDLGEMSNNLFLVECLAIAAYNSLIPIQEAFEKGNHLSDEKAKELNVFLAKVEKIKVKVEEKIKKSPENIFAHYLNAVISYSCAKAAEIFYQINANFFDSREKVGLFDVQQFYLESAVCDLDSIKKIQAFTQDVGKPYAPGMQFAFGRSLLRKLPADNLELMTSHLMQLTAVPPVMNK
jgi:hypothetical protein